MKIDDWIDWLTARRLARWNHIRVMAGVEEINRQYGAAYLAMLARNGCKGDLRSQQILDEIKARIAE